MVLINPSFLGVLKYFSRFCPDSSQQGLVPGYFFRSVAKKDEYFLLR